MNTKRLAYRWKRKHLVEPDDEAAARKPLTVNVREAVRLSGLSRSSIWKLIHSGVLNSVMVGPRRRLIIFASLEALLRAK
jgi:excisionase family DNA binding protein